MQTTDSASVAEHYLARHRKLARGELTGIDASVFTRPRVGDLVEVDGRDGDLASVWKVGACTVTLHDGTVVSDDRVRVVTRWEELRGTYADPGRRRTPESDFLAAPPVGREFGAEETEECQCADCRGQDDETEHLLSSPANAERLRRSIEQLDGPDLTTAYKADNSKPRHDLIPPYALDQLARVMTLGAAKYDDRNWEKGFKFGRLYGALQRHITAWWGGENKDPETGLSHLAHAMFNVAALLEHERRLANETLPGSLDDRPESDNR